MFKTNNNEILPQIQTNFTSIDEGCAGPRFMGVTNSCLGIETSIIKESGITQGCII